MKSRTRYRWDCILERLPRRRCRVAEIGVFKGANAEKILQGHKRVRLFLVDRWEPYTAEEAQQEKSEYMPNASAWKFAKAKKRTLQKVKPFQNRVKIYHMESTEAAKQFKDHFFHMVFIDAGHSYEAATADIKSWKRKVKPGGYIGGHDYPDRPGVKRAVEELFPKKQIQVDNDKTWFVKL